MGFDLEGKCLAFHGPLLYEAKVLKIYDPETKSYSAAKQEGPVAATDEDEIPDALKDQQCFFIHYQGWKATWDEWVGHERIREYNEENLALKKQLAQEAKEEKQKNRKKTAQKRKNEDVKKTQESGGGGGGGGGGSSSSSNNKKAKRASRRLTEEKDRAPRITLHIPTQLKSMLVDDWEWITKNKKLLSLPAKKNASSILNTYHSECSKKLASPIAQSQLDEFTSGLKLYLDKILPAMLLYRLERLQYDEYRDQPPSEVYGAMHLLRLLSILPELLASTTMDEQSCHSIVAQSEKLLVWLHDNIDQYLDTTRDYINTSSQYEGVALGM